MTILLCFLWALQEPSVDDLLRDLSHESAQAREKAGRRLADRWKEWTEADLQRIERVAAGRNLEAAIRAAEVFEEITRWRRIPAPLHEAAPNLTAIFRSGTADDAKGLIGRVRILVEKNKVSKLDAVPLWIEFLEDARETSEYAPSFSIRDGRKLTVADCAQQQLHAEMGKSMLSGRAAWRTWWAENSRKPEKEWYLPDLANPHEQFRVEAVDRLARLKDASVYPAMFDAVRSIRDNLRLAAAIGSLAELPQEVLSRELRPYLASPYPYGRLAAARLLFGEFRDDAVASVIQSLEKPGEMNLAGLDPNGFRSGNETIDWLAATHHLRADEFLARTLKTGSLGLKVHVLDGYARNESPEPLDVLAEALGDPEVHYASGTTYGATISNPRIGDLAGILLAERLKVKVPFEWTSSQRRRSVNLGLIRNGWRRKKGLPPLPVPSLEPPPVDSARVQPLLEKILANDDAAIEELCRLGPGAWGPLQARRRDSKGLSPAASAFARSLRGVEAQAAAEDLARSLKGRLDTPLRLEDLQAIGAAWFQDPRLSEIELEVEREDMGRGVFIALRVKKGDHSTPPNQVSFQTRQCSGAMIAEDKTFTHTWLDDFMGPFKDGLEADAESYVVQSVRMQKHWK